MNNSLVNSVCKAIRESSKQRFMRFCNAFAQPNFIRSWSSRRFSKKQVDASGLTQRERDEIDAEINEKLFFSAHIANEAILEKMKDEINLAIQGKSDMNKFVENIKRELGMDFDGSDFGSESNLDNRLRLIYKTNYGLAVGKVDYLSSMKDYSKNDFPCKELIRWQDRRVPRDWISRWRGEGGQIYHGRMIARVEDPIWSRISRFGLPYPPFDFNSGMGWQDISFEEAVELGVIEAESEEFEEVEEAITVDDLQIDVPVVQKENKPKEIEMPPIRSTAYHEQNYEDSFEKRAREQNESAWEQSSKQAFDDRMEREAMQGSGTQPLQFNRIETKRDGKAQEELDAFTTAIAAAMILSRKEREEEEERLRREQEEQERDNPYLYEIL